jgi:hypothetical protein
MNRQKFTYHFAMVVFTILLVLVGDTYFYYYDGNETVTLEQFNQMFIKSIGFSIFINALIFVSNYFVKKGKKM